MAQENQTGILYQPREVRWGGRWEGGSKGRGYMYTYGWFMLRFDRKQQKSVNYASIIMSIIKSMIMLQLKKKKKKNGEVWSYWSPRQAVSGAVFREGERLGPCWFCADTCVMHLAQDCNARLAQGTASLHMACLPPSWIAVLCATLHRTACPAPVSVKPFHARNSALKCGLRGLCMKQAPDEQVKLDYPERKREKRG